MESHTETKAAKQRWEAAKEVASSQWWGAGLASAASALVTTVAAAASSLLSPSLQPWLVSKHWAYISTVGCRCGVCGVCLSLALSFTPKPARHILTLVTTVCGVSVVSRRHQTLMNCQTRRQLLPPLTCTLSSTRLWQSKVPLSSSAGVLQRRAWRHSALVGVCVSVHRGVQALHDDHRHSTGLPCL